MNVVDANVILSGLRSRNGASHAVLTEMLRGTIPFAVSPAVMVEYEDLLKRPGILGPEPWLRPEQIDAVLDALCDRLTPSCPFFRYRPFLSDPKDDLYIECAMAAAATVIVTHDRHFQDPAVPAFGIEVLSPREFIVRLTSSRRSS
ncbi:putative toxin-antitoxin system toxin component, PIN family [Methylobacterium sp. J-076]|uniref:PIN domain-containing protein n=1 Tax=Methylobacterium sp. J-076 TaxID=2836655 RepID=UPI001FBAC6A1|nr:PIN domain-containing protein [Methylobacterium sp. J-076]MCJ2012008.1 PIN domain-containing protein [Methylobacterium sp. J-076]